MNLHEDGDAFSELVALAAEIIGLPQIYVEKDYWVTKALKHLSQSRHVDEVVFKGGTSLSKAYRLIDRFSEDIDLAVFSGDRGSNAQKGLLKDVEGAVTQGLDKLEKDERESKGSNYRKTVYQYPRSIDGSDFGQASPELLVEVNAFTRPEPYERRELQTLIADVLSKEGRDNLISQFGLESFSINVLSVKRTLIEKMLGSIKDSYDADPAKKLSGRIRHLYDICLILREDEYRDYVQGEEFESLCTACIEDEKSGFFGNSDCLEKPLADAPIFSDFADWRTTLDATYKGTFSNLVYGELPDMEEVVSTLHFLHKQLKS